MYYTGSVNNWTDLRTAIFSACTANGWTLTTDVLSKGAAFLRITVSTATSGVPGPGLILQGGTGYSAGSLVNPSPVRPRLGAPTYAGTQIVFPIEYFIHVFNNPDEVYVVIKSNIDFFHFGAFGVANIPGVLGTKLWLGASGSYNASNGSAGVCISPTTGGVGPVGALFWNSEGQTISADYYVDTMHVNIDGITWANNNVGSGVRALVGQLAAVSAAAPMLSYSPNTWNSASNLIRIRGLFYRTSNKSSLVLDLKNSRYIRVDNFEPGQIFTLGLDKWVVYPWYRKNTAQRDAGGSSATPHSGTMGWAIKYDGP